MIQPHLLSVGRGQLDVGKRHAGEVVGRTVVDGRRKRLGQRQRVVRSHHSIISGHPNGSPHSKESDPAGRSSLADVFEKVAIRNLRRVIRAECGWRVSSVSTVPASSRCR